MTKTVLNLTELTDGQGGIVVGVDGSAGKRRDQDGTLKACSEEKCGFVRRLMDLGLTPGAKVMVVKSAPFNGPLEILVRGSRIALGRCVASRIKVEVTG
ncbi:MAG: FeoA family protein [Promethearchaeati archaeon SRVP18_Atabeyarchaeia-1]